MKSLLIAAVILLIAEISGFRLPQELESRIIGGQNAAVGQFKWQTAVYGNPSNSFCGGAVITPNVVMTAAHCIYQPPSITNNRTDIVFGILYLDDNTQPNYLLQTATGTKCHESFSMSTLVNDIAVAWVPTLTYNAEVAAIALPTSNTDQFVGAAAQITG